MFPTDAHDDLLMTPRETTVVRQNTNQFDRMPNDMFGSSEDEENLFSGIGADPQAGPSFLDKLGSKATSAIATATGTAAAAGVAALSDANALAAMQQGDAPAKAVYDGVMALKTADREAWLATRPNAAKALVAFAAAGKLPSPVPAKQVNWALWGGVAAALAVAFYLMKSKKSRA